MFVRWTFSLLSVGLMVAVTTPVAAQQADGANTSEKIPEKVLRAWKAAGATLGWLGRNSRGFMQFSNMRESLHEPIPAFRFENFVTSRLKKLPDPEIPFGLSFQGNAVTNATLKELAQWKSLVSLDLQLTQVTDTGLKELAVLENLQALCLYSTPVTDTGLKALAGLKKLTWLELGCTQVTDKGLKHLTGLSSLRTLGLQDSKVTDQGMKELVGLKGLKEVDVSRTEVSDAGAEQLQKAVPGCSVFRFNSGPNDTKE